MSQSEPSTSNKQKVQQKVQQILTREEKVLFIAVQNSPLSINLSPDSVVLTNRRFIIYRPKLLGGASFEDYIWRDLQDARLKEGMMRSTLTFKTVKGKVLHIIDLPKEEARRAYAIAQEMEEKVLEERRQRQIEEKRAAAGGVILHQERQASPPPVLVQEDPMETLAKLKKMLTAELITQEEYEAKKTDILARM